MTYRICLLIGVVVLCLGCGHTVPSPTTESTAVFNAAGARVVEFNVPDMTCPHGCAPAVKEILVKQPGAKDVLVDYDNKTAKVAIEEGQFDAEQAIAALVDRQFPNSSLKDETAITPQPAAGIAQ